MRHLVMWMFLPGNEAANDEFKSTEFESRPKNAAVPALLSPSLL